MSKPDGGPAFPHEHLAPYINAAGMPENRPQRWFGMSLRDYFAGQALAGMFAERNILKDANTSELAELCFLNAAAFSYRMADTMIAERAK